MPKDCEIYYVKCQCMTLHVTYINIRTTLTSKKCPNVITSSTLSLTHALQTDSSINFYYKLLTKHFTMKFTDFSNAWPFGVRVAYEHSLLG